MGDQNFVGIGRRLSLSEDPVEDVMNAKEPHPLRAVLPGVASLVPSLLLALGHAHVLYRKVPWPVTALYIAGEGLLIHWQYCYIPNKDSLIPGRGGVYKEEKKVEPLEGSLMDLRTRTLSRASI